MRPVRVELLYFEQCPNHRDAEDLVRRVASAAGVAVDLRRVEVADDDAAQGLRFLGSPTLRVDGHDVEPGAGERRDFQRACRLYRSDTGLRRLPEEAQVRRALSSAAAR
jgi:hypothetical protein